MIIRPTFTNNNKLSFEAKGVYPGSFDPFTKGHLDMVEKGSKLFDELTILVAKNPDKPGFLPVDQRADLIKQSVGHLKNVTVDTYEGMTVNYAKEHDAEFMLRGLRNGKDFEEEANLADINNKLSNDVETVFLPSKPENMSVSSTVVRKLIQIGGDISSFVPKPVSDFFKNFGK